MPAPPFVQHPVASVILAQPPAVILAQPESPYLPLPQFTPSRLRLRALLPLALLSLAVTGCQARFSSQTGVVSSHGGPLGQWSLRPDGCSLAPFDGQPVASSHSVVALVWQRGRPTHFSKHGSENRWAQGPRALEISREPTGLAATFILVQTHQPVRLDASVCPTLQLETHPGPPVFAGAPPSLNGHLVLDCTVESSHLTGDVNFRGCLL